MRVLTWNVWWRFGEQWRERQIAIAATLAAHQPEIVGLQESWAAREASQASVLAAPLGLHSVFGGPSLPDPVEEPGHDGVDLGLAILSRWPIRHSWTHRLPSSRAAPPVALVAAVDHPDGVLHVCVCAEHHADLADDHLAQTRELARLVTELSTLGSALPVLLLGDLNAGPDTPEIAALTSHDGIVDAWTASGGGDGDGVTLSAALPIAPLGAVKQLDRRIDYVLFRRSTGGPAPAVTHAAVVDEPVDGLYASDHFAVVADLAL